MLTGAQRTRCAPHGSWARVLLACAVAVPTRALAHDYWLVPEFPVVDTPEPIPIRMYVGEALRAEEERPHQSSKTERLRLFTATGPLDLLPSAADKAKPAYVLLPERPGGHLVVLDRNRSHIDLEASRFESYLRDEGLESIVEERARRGEAGARGREDYTRHLKSLVQVGDARDGAFSVVTGQPLEIVPAENPIFVRPGENLAVDVYFKGAKLSGALLEAVSRVGDDVVVHPSRTDARGRASFVLDRAASWLLRITHMERCVDCADADWRSYWGSYFFASREEGRETRPSPMFEVQPAGPSRARFWIFVSVVVALVCAAAGAIRVRRR